MSEEIKTGAEGTSPEAQPNAELGNLKAEFNRKLSNLEQSNQQLLAQLQSMAAPKAAPKEEKKLSDIMYENPDEYARIVEERAEQRVMSKLEKQQAQMTKQNATIGALVQDYPELNDNNHDLTKKAVEVFNSLSDEDKASPIAYKLAVKEAALELGLKPKSKRSSSDDNFTMSSGSGGTGSRPKRESDIDPATIAFAEAVGVKINDPKVKERLKGYSKRKNWLKYE